jgi:hypothetical protein
MCITVNKASLSSTKILSLPLENGNHFLSYSNNVQNKSGRPNAMILPIPGKVKQEWFYNTEPYKNFLNEIINKSRLQEDYWGHRVRSASAKGKSLSYFELGMYHIALTDNFLELREFLLSLPDLERPDISEDLQKFFNEKYNGWSFVLCLFSSDKEIDAQPIALEYTPFNPGLIYYPTMDSHDGGAPNLNEQVQMDHTFIYEHTGPRNPKIEYFMDSVDLKAQVPEFLQKRKYRTIASQKREINGDTYIDRDVLLSTPFEDDVNLYRSAPLKSAVLNDN